MRLFYFLMVSTVTLLLYQNCASENESFQSAGCSGPSCSTSSGGSVDLEIKILGAPTNSLGLAEIDPTVPLRLQISPNVNWSTGACIEFLPLLQASDACDLNVLNYPISNHSTDWTEVTRGVYQNSALLPLNLNLHGVQAIFYAQRSQDTERTRQAFRIKSVLEVPLTSLGDKSFHWYSADTAGLNTLRKISRQNLPVHSNVFRLFGENGFSQSVEMCFYRQGLDGAKPAHGHFCDLPGRSTSVTKDSFVRKDIAGRNGHHANPLSSNLLPVSITKIETYVKKNNQWLLLSSVDVVP